MKQNCNNKLFELIAKGALDLEGVMAYRDATVADLIHGQETPEYVVTMWSERSTVDSQARYNWVAIVCDNCDKNWTCDKYNVDVAILLPNCNEWLLAWTV